MSEQRDIIWVAGPCSAESAEQVLQTAEYLKGKVDFFRAGLWKPRTMPSYFEGVGEKGLPWLLEARERYGLKIGTEVATPKQMCICLDAKLDFVWLGARTTTNPILVQQLADCLVSRANSQSASYLPVVFIKNPIAPDLNLWLGAICRFQAAGTQVIAVHRGFKTTDMPIGDYRFSPVWSLPIELKRRMPELTLLHDPSHTSGRADLVEQLADQAMRLDFDGLMVEVHPNPDEALSDARQQLSFGQFDDVFNKTKKPKNQAVDIELAQLRKQIDEVDEQLWNAVLLRQELSEKVGEYKRKHALKVFQSGRYREILERRRQWGLQHGISEVVIDKIVEALHTASVEKQL